MARAPERPLAAEPARAEVKGAADDEVARKRHDAAGDHRPDRDEHRVVLRVVVQRARCARAERHGDARQADEREHRLRPGLDVLTLLVPQGGEDRPRREQHGGHAQPPIPLPVVHHRRG